MKWSLLDIAYVVCRRQVLIGGNMIQRPCYCCTGFCSIFTTPAEMNKAKSVVLPYMKVKICTPWEYGYVIGASLREPHTSELNGGIFLIYICIYVCMYISYVVRPMHAYARRVRAKGVWSNKGEAKFTAIHVGLRHLIKGIGYKFANSALRGVVLWPR